MLSGLIFRVSIQKTFMLRGELIWHRCIVRRLLESPR